MYSFCFWCTIWNLICYGNYFRKYASRSLSSCKVTISLDSFSFPVFKLIGWRCLCMCCRLWMDNGSYLHRIWSPLQRGYHRHVWVYPYLPKSLQVTSVVLIFIPYDITASEGVNCLFHSETFLISPVIYFKILDIGISYSAIRLLSSIPHPLLVRKIVSVLVKWYINTVRE